MKVVIPTCDKYIHRLQPFAYLFSKFWSDLQPVFVIGYNQPSFSLPPNYIFHSVSTIEYPQEQWSTALRQGLQAIDDEFIVLMLEDYWLIRTVDVSGVSTLHEYMQNQPRNILRMDLTSDRLYNGHRTDIGYYGHYDLVETPSNSEYQMSFQAGIWNRNLLLSVLAPEKSPWEIEMHTQPPETMRVLGTRQHPVRYANACLGGNSSKLQNLSEIPEQHIAIMSEMGII